MGFQRSKAYPLTVLLLTAIAATVNSSVLADNEPKNIEEAATLPPTYEPELIAYCQARACQAPLVVSTLKQICPSATTDGIADGVKSLVGSFMHLKGNNSAVDLSNQEFPSRDLLEIVDLELANHEFNHRSCINFQHEPSYYDLLARYRKLVAKQRRDTSITRLIFEHILRTEIDKAILDYRNNKI